ncbi:hypothetical protein M406DRAFT_335739 [Cryphonectria parasitica EP155]|uniref:SRP9 domain-containing protein n=1 Tax=Cryphonectria parasitica (strain ATCC 38755 / EP155) TaxID=660469 RepID=A0A9P4YAD5_CRYP1|nr:uncharacterized protein M406DRAFT_335739 [Cryphonectria parasitica EP155]KAF3769974.1 hypothetical protein M406DRAFT_335739 [Cryphonectria parasitica EP155]
MPFIPTADEWLTLSAQLLEARPTTTAARARKARSKPQDATEADTPMPDASASTARPPRAKLILKAFDPHSGVCLKYKTAKAQEVGRLVQMLGSLGRNMAAMPSALPAVAAEEDLAGTAATPPVTGGAQLGGAPAAGGAGDGGKGKKKKKGKR